MITLLAKVLYSLLHTIWRYVLHDGDGVLVLGLVAGISIDPHAIKSILSESEFPSVNAILDSSHD